MALVNRDRGAYAPLPHHRTCGSASGGSVKYDEFDIAQESFSVQTLANRCCLRRDEPAAILKAATFPSSSHLRVQPSILKLHVLSGWRTGFAASSIVSTLFVAFGGAAFRQIESYAFDHLPRHSN